MIIISAIWEPMFKTDDGKDAKLKYYNFITGQPDCETMQHRPIYYLGDTEDEWVSFYNYLHYVIYKSQCMGPLENLAHGRTLKEVNSYTDLQLDNLTCFYCKRYRNEFNCYCIYICTNYKSIYYLIATRMSPGIWTCRLTLIVFCFCWQIFVTITWTRHHHLTLLTPTANLMIRNIWRYSFITNIKPY